MCVYVTTSDCTGMFIVGYTKSLVRKLMAHISKIMWVDIYVYRTTNMQLHVYPHTTTYVKLPDKCEPDVYQWGLHIYVCGTTCV